MFEYTVATKEQEHYSAKRQRDYDRMAARGLKKTMKVEQMMMKALRKELVREWTRTERERAEAPTCPGSSVSVVVVHGQVRVQEITLVQDGCEGTAIVFVPLSHW